MQMPYEEALRTFGPIGAVLLALAFAWYRGRPAGERFSDNLVERVTKLEVANTLLVTQVTELRMENHELSLKLQMLESNHQSLPLAMWMKDTTSRMLTLNEPYEKMFLKPRGMTAKDYIGKLDSEVWPKDLADAFINHDRALLLSEDEVWYGREYAIGTDGKRFPLFVVKYVRRAAGVPVGISGLAIPVDEFLEKALPEVDRDLLL